MKDSQFALRQGGVNPYNFGRLSSAILRLQQAPNTTALWNKYDVATDYNAVWRVLRQDPGFKNADSLGTEFSSLQAHGQGHSKPTSAIAATPIVE